jgi:hypothetical protein
MDDEGPITLGEIRAYRGAQARLDRHRRDIATLNDAVVKLAKHTGYPSRSTRKASNGDDPLPPPVPESEPS